MMAYEKWKFVGPHFDKMISIQMKLFQEWITYMIGVELARLKNVTTSGAIFE